MISLFSWNVNGVRAACKKGFAQWVSSIEPDILAIQETKSHREQLSDNELLSNYGYTAHFTTPRKRGYSGLGLYSKIKPLGVEKLGIDEFDDEGRVQIAYFQSLIVVNCYFPNSQHGATRLGYKLAFCQAIAEKLAQLQKQQLPLCICGDFNIAHRPIDLARPRQNENNPGYLPQERAWMDCFLQSGYIDTFRHLHPQPHNYTWWSYRAQAREKNIGWRIDYFCLPQSWQHLIDSAAILPHVFGSDHCPIELNLKIEKASL